MIFDGQPRAWIRRLVVFMLGLCLLPAPARADLWRTGYYPGWEQIAMGASNIDFTALTHIIHFSLMPRTDGSLDADQNVIPPNYSADLITRAHAAGLKVLICVGGGKTENQFLGATTPAHLPVFINNLTSFMASRGYDGIDVDWEPLPIAEAQPYTNLLLGLRAALNKFPGPKLLTVAAGAYPNYGDNASSEYLLYADIQGQLDQINIMTYDLSGPYDGWVTWFNSPVYDGGYRFHRSATHPPSVNGSVASFIACGVPAAKLGVGIPFYGYAWVGSTNASAPGPTGPRQPWTRPPVIIPFGYNDLIATFYQPALYHWDTNAQAAYLSLAYANPVHNAFISYDDQRACQAKVNYARDHHLGGLMIWEIGLDHTRGQPDPLLQAIKEAAGTNAPPLPPSPAPPQLPAPPPAPPIQIVNLKIDLNVAAFTLDSYRSLVTNTPASTLWDILLTTINLTTPAPATNQIRHFSGPPTRFRPR